MAPSRHLVLVALAAALLATVWVPFGAPPARAGIATVFSEDFESGALPPGWSTADGDPASGLDYWGVSSYRAYGGTRSAWASQVGTQSDTGFNNSAVQQYDDDMQADLAIDLNVSGFTSLTLSFYYWVRAEGGGGDWIQAWYEANGTQTIIFTNSGTARWDLASVAVPTDVERLIIRFNTDAANHGFEGAYIDDLLLTGTESVPPTSSVSPLPTYTNLVPYLIPYSAQDNPNASGVAYVELHWRAGTAGAFALYTRPANPLGRWYVSPISFDASFAAGDGYYEFYTVAYDNAQNVEAPPVGADASLTFDTVPPSLAILGPSDGVWSNASTMTVLWQGSDAGSGMDRFETSLDGGAFSSEGNATSATFAGLADGSHAVDVRAVDVAGNAATERVSFGVDATAPAVTIRNPADRKTIHTSTIVIQWEASDATSGIDHYEVWLDSGTPERTTDLRYVFTGVRDGAHTAHVRAVDRAGNAQEATAPFPVNTNIFSWDGPYGSLPLLLLLVLILLILFAMFLWWKKRGEKSETPHDRVPPEDAESPEPPEPDEGAPPPPEPI